MTYVLITAGGIALCSFVGAVIGFLFENIPPRVEDAVSGAAAGIMLCAAVLGLVMPSMEFSGGKATWLPALGIFCGAGFLTLINLACPRLTEKLGMKSGDRDSRDRTLLFVMAIAIHHFPEGIAAGVSFGTGDVSDAVTVCSGIAFQNVPEAMIIIPPLLKAGTGKRRAAVIAFISGFVEVVGVFYLVNCAAAVCTGLCGGHDAVCDNRRHGTADPCARQRPPCDLRHALRLLSHARSGSFSRISKKPPKIRGFFIYVRCFCRFEDKNFSCGGISCSMSFTAHFIARSDSSLHRGCFPLSCRELRTRTHPCSRRRWQVPWRLRTCG